jgi:filamentous hemagglutinin family protein
VAKVLSISPIFQISLCTLGYLLSTSNISSAQVTSDGTTGTVVDANGNSFEINAGTRSGGNLFHSFGQFSVPTGGQAVFNNAVDVSNILSRVTGGNVSQINGLIEAQSGANLFLINPAGIIFGQGASLNIGGSFYGSTADSILFEDGEFSAVNDLNQPILRINAPIGLGFRDNPAPIENNSKADAGLDPAGVDGYFGLRVPDGKSFALAGGDIKANGGGIVTFGGRIDLAAVGGEGTLGLTTNGDDFSFSFPDNLLRADVSLNNQADFLVAAGGGGDIAINARNIDIENKSSLNAGILSNLGSTDSQAGNIFINARNLNVINSSTISNSVFGKGNAGDLIVNVENFIVQDSQISSSTFGEGNAGDLIVNASESVKLSGEDPDGFPGGLFAQVDIKGKGDGGDLTIDTKRLSVSDGSKIQVSTFGLGNSGDLTIRASEIDVFETPIDNFFSTGIFAETSLANTPGSPDIQAIGKGNAGNLTIETDRLMIKDGGQISASTRGIGNAGTLTVKASDSIEVSGIEDANAFGGSKGGSRSVSFLAAEVIEGATGKGGNLNIETGQLKIVNEGKISVSALNESGTAGNLDINANSIQLDRSQISAATAFGEGGNINLKIDDTLTMRNDSLISAQALNDANGGNVNIDTNFIVAFPNQNNDIIANADNGKGGNISITAESVFGIEERILLNDLTNDINVSSEFGLDGTVSIFTPDINPVQGATELPSNVVEPEQTTAQACQANREAAAKNGLVINGKGGLPATPDQPLTSQNLLINGEVTSAQAIPEPIETSQGKIQLARGIKFTKDGGIILTPYPTNNAGERIPEGRINCGEV